MSTTHTPAPWRVEGRKVHGANTGHIISHGINSHGDGPNGYVCDTDGTTDADARLIAAAPELLEALEYLLEACIANPDAKSKARAAIAKATGAA
jgi:hypothetical protein